MGLPQWILMQNTKFSCMAAEALDGGCFSLHTTLSE